MLKRIRLEVKASIAIMIATFITQAANFLTTPIFTRILSVEEYGLIAQYNSWQNILMVISTLSLAAGVFQVAMNEFKNDRDKFTFSSIILSNIVTVIVFGLIFAFIGFFSAFFELPQSLLLLMFIYMLLYPAMEMWLSRQKYEYNYVQVLLVSILSAIASQTIAVICVLTIKDVNLGVVKLWASCGSMCIFGLVLYLIIAIKCKFKVSFSYIKFAFVFNAPLLLHYLSQYILRSSDKIMITHFLGEKSTGIYSLASTVATISIYAWAAMSASLTPYVYDNLNKSNYNKINNACVFVEFLFGICCVLVVLLGPEIIFILGSEKYSDGIWLIPPIAASCILQAVYSFYSTFAFYHHKRLSTAIMTIIAAGINIGLNSIFIPRYGYIAAAYTTEVAYLIYTFLHFINYKRITKETKIYNNYMILGLMIIFTIICLAIGFLYNFSPLIRYSISVIGVVFLLIYLKKIINRLKGFVLNNNDENKDKTKEIINE